MLVAYGHRSRCGKNTAALYTKELVSNLKPEWQIVAVSFADQIKSTTWQLYKHLGVKTAQYYEENPEEREIIIPALGINVVELWRRVGKNFRDIYYDTWVDLTLIDRSEDLVIISDLRFPNEAKKIKDLGGYCIKVERDSIVNDGSEADNALSYYDEWDYVIENNSTVENLKDQVSNLMDLIVKK